MINIHVNNCNTNSSILSNLFFADETVFECFFFLFLVNDKTFLIIPIDIKIAKVKVSPAIPSGASITLADDAIHTPLDTAVNAIIILSA